MSSQFAAKTCTPCRGGIPPLDIGRARLYLNELPGWSLEDQGLRIERRFTFKDFAEALAFVDKVGEASETEGHHPDIAFGWGWATVSWQTKKIKGLHENDFIMAAKTDQIAAG